MLLVYTTVQEKDVEIVTKVEYVPKVKTIVKEKVVYLDRECKEKAINKEEIETIFEEKKEDIKEHIIASISDVSHRFEISLFSYLEPLFVRDYKKVVLNGRLRNDESKSIFIMDVNLAILENINDIYFQVKDNQTGEAYITQETCLYNLLENYIYKVDLEILGGVVTCNFTEDIVIEDNSKKIPIHTKINQNIENTFLKMNSNGIRPSVE